jgi:hypothetical protein
VTQYKGKGKGRDHGKGKYGPEKGKGKGKGRGKGKAHNGYRKEVVKEEPKVTNNRQLIYLEEPTATGGNDEMTVMFTQNMNRILINEETNENDHVNDSPSITQLITEMTNLPDDYPVWQYMNPTDTYCHIHGIDTTATNRLDEFIKGYNTHIHVMNEMKAKIRKPHHDPDAQVDDHHDWGSLSNEPITWGQTIARDHEEKLKLWNESSSCVTDNEEVSEKGVNNGEPHVKTPDDVSNHLVSSGPTTSKTAYAKEEHDDELEYIRIPIAGEDSEDYEDDDETEEVEDEALPLLQPTQHEDVNTTTGVIDDDIAYLIGHVDGVVQVQELTPLREHRNRYADLGEVVDKLTFTQNMQGMQRYKHKRKITREEKRLDEEAEHFHPLLFSDAHGEPPSQQQTESQGSRIRAKAQQDKRKYQRLNASPITIPGTPDGKEARIAK